MSHLPDKTSNKDYFSEKQLKEFEVAKIKWTLQGSNSPMNRIYATCKHLGSKLSYAEIESLVNSLIADGVIKESKVIDGIPSTYQLI